MGKGDEKKTVWVRVKEALKDAGLPHSQIKAAEICGIEQPSVSEWNKARAHPKLENIITLAKKTGVCVEWLYTGRGPKWPGDVADPILHRLLPVWNDIDDDIRGRILGYALVSRGGPGLSLEKKTHPKHPPALT